jgi:2-polyprenyl-6-methoxyphenol hydroxylase-like FAD-dependent oxidoreductase
MPTRVVVIGAGIAGLATAVALQRRGFDITVFEEKTDASSGAGISIWPNALAALDEFGLGDAVRDAGSRVSAGSVRWRDGRWLRRPHRDRVVNALSEPLVVVQRSALTDVLQGGLSPGTVRGGVGVAGVEQAADGVRLQLSDGAGTEVDAVIAADGMNSAIARKRSGGPGGRSCSSAMRPMRCVRPCCRPPLPGPACSPRKRC